MFPAIDHKADCLLAWLSDCPSIVQPIEQRTGMWFNTINSYTSYEHDASRQAALHKRAIAVSHHDLLPSQPHSAPAIVVIFSRLALRFFRSLVYSPTTLLLHPHEHLTSTMAKYEPKGWELDRLRRIWADPKNPFYRTFQVRDAGHLACCRCPENRTQDYTAAWDMEQGRMLRGRDLMKRLFEDICPCFEDKYIIYGRIGSGSKSSLLSFLLFLRENRLRLTFSLSLWNSVRRPRT